MQQTQLQFDLKSLEFLSPQHQDQISLPDFVLCAVCLEAEKADVASAIPLRTSQCSHVARKPPAVQVGCMVLLILESHLNLSHMTAAHLLCDLQVISVCPGE